MVQYTKRQVADRMFMCAIIFFTALAPYLSAECIAHDSHGNYRDIAHALLGMLNVVAFADTLVNDTLSNKYAVKISLYARQMVWMLLGAGLAGLAFVNLRYYADYTQAVWSILFGVRCISIAFLDLRYELAQLQQENSKCVTPSAHYTSSP